jgi:hypothetical protein
VLLALWATNRLKLQTIADFELSILQNICRHCEKISSDASAPIRDYLLGLCFRFSKKNKIHNKHKDEIIKALRCFNCALYHSPTVIDAIFQGDARDDTLLLFGEWMGGLESMPAKLQFVQLLMERASPLEKCHTRVNTFLLVLCKKSPDVSFVTLVDGNFASLCFQSNVPQIRKLVLELVKQVLLLPRFSTEDLPEFLFSILCRYFQDEHDRTVKLQMFYVLSEMLHKKVETKMLLKSGYWVADFLEVNDISHFLRPITEIVAALANKARGMQHQDQRELNQLLRNSLVPSLLNGLHHINRVDMKKAKAKVSDATKQRSAAIIACAREALFIIKTVDLISCITAHTWIQREFSQLVISKFTIENAENGGIDVDGFVTYLINASTSDWRCSKVLTSSAKMVPSVKILIRTLHAAKPEAYYALISSLWARLDESRATNGGDTIQSIKLGVHVLEVLNIAYAATSMKIDGSVNLDSTIIRPVENVVLRLTSSGTGGTFNSDDIRETKLMLRLLQHANLSNVQIQKTEECCNYLCVTKACRDAAVKCILYCSRKPQETIFKILAQGASTAFLVSEAQAETFLVIFLSSPLLYLLLSPPPPLTSSA